MGQPTIHKIKTEDGTRYWFRIDVGINPKTNNRKQRKVTCKTRQEAQAKLAEMQASIARGSVVEKRRNTVAELLHAWLEARQPHLSPNARASYERTINIDIIPMLGSVRVQALTPVMVHDFLTAKLDDMRTRGKDGTRTVELCRQRLSEALDEAVSLEMVVRNVAAKVELPARRHRKPPKVLTPEQTARYLSVAAKSCYGPIWMLAAYTGMRRGELAGLRWQDIDLDKGLLTVNQTVIMPGGPPQIKPSPKTPSGRRSVPVAVEAVAALREHKARQNERRLALGRAWCDYDLVFTTSIGTPINLHNLRRDHVRWLHEAGLDDTGATIHSHRHSFVTQAKDAGVSIVDVSRVIGHSRPSTTADIYTVTDSKAARKVTDAVGAAIANSLQQDAQGAM